MISEGPSLIEALPAPLQNALNGAVQPDEVLRIAVKGGSREALAATDRRILILREPLAAAAVEIGEIPLGEVQRVELNGSPGGARLQILRNAGGEPFLFEVPVYETAKFERVVERLNRSATGTREAASSPAGAPIRPGAARNCPGCATAIPEGGVFCPRCRLQVADACAFCGFVLQEGWQHCPRCGVSALLPHALLCPSCSEPLWPSGIFCTECGAQVRPRCAGCGGALMTDWDYCPGCGTPTPANEEAVASGAPPAAPAPDSRVVPSPVEDLAEAERLNAAGIQAYESERLDEAIAYFQRAILRAPRVASYHTNLGVACGENGMDLEAYAAYRRALELDPNELQARLNLGSLYAERERYQQARDVWEGVIAAAPDSDEAREARDNLDSLDEL
jgi:tetratricopeptide (TPR) repeat protein